MPCCHCSLLAPPCGVGTWFSVRSVATKRQPGRRQETSSISSSSPIGAIWVVVHERATRRGSSGPSENGPRKGSRGQPQPRGSRAGPAKGSSEQQKGKGGGDIAQAATPAAATFRRSAGARARCGAKTTCTKKDPAAGEGARRCGAACGAASAGSSSSSPRKGSAATADANGECAAAS